MFGKGKCTARKQMCLLEKRTDLYNNECIKEYTVDRKIKPPV